MSEPAELQAIARKRRGLDAVPQAVWAPLAGAALVLIAGLLGLATGNAWLVPSVGPTALLQATLPQLPTARLYNVVLGHFIGIALACAAVIVLGATAEPSVIMQKQLFPMRVAASVLAVGLTILVQDLLRCQHPPAAASVLLITLGAFEPSVRDMTTLGGAILITAICGELLRRLRLAQPGQK